MLRADTLKPQQATEPPALHKFWLLSLTDRAARYERVQVEVRILWGLPFMYDIGYWVTISLVNYVCAWLTPREHLLRPAVYAGLGVSGLMTGIHLGRVLAG